MKRLPAIDIARGLVMVIMALDHTRDYLHIHAAQSPTDLTTTTPVLFFTRWVTHLCAPSFVFLSGISAWLYLYGSGRRAFLWKRGLALIGIEFTLVNFALFFDLRFRVFLFEVIAAIGAGMILLSLLSRLKPRITLAIAIVLFAGHDLIAFVKMPADPVIGFFGSLLFGPGAFPLGSGRLFVIAYPILPWLSIMLLGFCAGQVFAWPAAAQRKFFIRTGLAAIVIFIVLRSINVYGDPVRSATQKNGVYTFLSFMNVSKYPPSLLFSLATLGVLLLILAAATKNPSPAAAEKPLAAARESAVVRILLVYGRVPLFFFIVHLYLIHTIMIVMVLCQGYPWSRMDFSPFKFGRPETAGLSLGVVYVIWVAVVIALYPLCRWYGNYKATHKEKTWLRYL